MDAMKARLVCLFALLFGLAPIAGVAAEKSPIPLRHLKSLLHNQGFSGALAGDVTFNYLGKFVCGAEEFRVFYFVWTQTRPRGVAMHGQQRLILVGDKERYAGSYMINDRPTKVEQDTIIFPYDAKDGNEIRCKEGVLPEDAELGGGGGDLEK
jgi:hypothetical protein